SPSDGAAGSDMTQLADTHHTADDGASWVAHRGDQDQQPSVDQPNPATRSAQSQPPKRRAVVVQGELHGGGPDLSAVFGASQPSEIAAITRDSATKAPPQWFIDAQQQASNH